MKPEEGANCSRSFSSSKGAFILILLCQLVQLTVQRGTNFWLICQFQLENTDSVNDQLYSVKWYKNNEEFYRLLLNDAPTSASGQQQYFAQSGINVVMSGSNATHVRLLNASLDTEGVYACEISTQNLSTIRYEREIRVYVLPHARINIIGFRRSYSIGDLVDLTCSSDFSKPQPALAWFINGKRIHSNIADQQLELTSSSKSKLNEPSLFKLNLTLKFKLTLDLLASFNSKHHHQQQQQQTNRRNQSRSRRLVSSVQQQEAGMLLSPYQSPRAFELKLQCRYALTEISDLTYNELALRAPEVVATGRRSPSSFLTSTSSSSGLSSSSSPRDLRLNKLTDNRVLQSETPASEHALWRSLNLPTVESLDTCRLGSLALHADDPLIVESSSSSREGSESMELTNLRLKRRSFLSNNRFDQTETEVGDELHYNCLTIGCLVEGLAETSLDQATTTAAASGGGTLNFCSDTRKRSIISGKFQPNEDQLQSAVANQQRARQQQQQQRNKQVAYLTLPPIQWAESRRFRDNSNNNNNNNTVDEARQLGADSSDWPRVSQAPPLLEWFINNQEAPRSSVSYEPALPLMPSSQPDWSRFRPPGSASAILEAPSVDYAEYFANFEPRPNQQQLSLTLSKKDFTSPDSELRLRCSSTQAQLLLSDLTSVTIVVLPADGQNRTAWQQADQRSTGSGHHSYQRSPQRGGGGGRALVAREKSGAISFFSVYTMLPLLLLTLSMTQLVSQATVMKPIRICHVILNMYIEHKLS